MQPLPHIYKVTSITHAEDNVLLYSNATESLKVAPPPEFGGQDDLWSPETCLVGAVASCYALSFRAVARRASLKWNKLDCEVGGTLAKTDGTTRFTEIEIIAHLELSAGGDMGMAESLLMRAERLCLITNSLMAEVILVADVQLAEPVMA